MFLKNRIRRIYVVIFAMYTVFVSVRSSNAFQLCFKKDTIRDMVCDQAGNIWVGTFGLGLWKISGDKISKIFDKETNQPYSMINKLDLDKKHLWVSTAGNGCSAMNLKTGKFDIIPKVNGFDRLHAFIKTSNNKILIGSVGSGSAILQDNFWKPINLAPPMSRKWVNCFSEWQKKLWIGTSIGLFSLDLDKLKVKWRPRHINVGGGVNCLFPLDNRLYIGTTGRGLCYLDLKNKKHNEKNTYGSIYKIFIWGNNLWAIGQAGLWKLAGNDITLVVNYKFSTPKAAVVDSNGRLTIGTIDGKIIMTSDGKKFMPIFKFTNDKLVRITKSKVTK